MRAINVTLDVYSGILCLILLTYLLKRGDRRDRAGKFFILMCAFSFGSAVGDIPNWVCEGYARAWYPAALWIGTVVYWLCTTGLLVAFTAYVIEYLKPKVRVNPVFFRICLLLGGLHAFGILMSIGNGMFFIIAPGNVYRRGEWFWLSQLIPFLIYALDVSIFVSYRQRLLRRDFAILTSYIALPLLAEAVQIMCFGLALLSAGVSIGLLIIFINVQSERELRFERQEKVLAQQHIDIMLSQIQPHFLYNALTAIRRLCDHDPEQAKVAIREFSLFLRANMDSLKSKAPVPFEKELNHVENYIALEQRRFQNRLKVIYDIRCRDFSIPPLTVQPIVENAVRHGILRREQGGTITILTEETASGYSVKVMDDGVGINVSKAKETDEGGAHIGIENVRGRLASLCAGELTITSEPNIGTTAVITIPKEGMKQ